MNSPVSLARQHTRLLALAFLLIELFVAAVLAWFLMLPLARRSADDLAGLMILSAQTWAELPPATRPAFEFELFANHDLALRADLSAPAGDAWHPPYFYFLEDALAKRLGARQHLVGERVGGAVWYWANLPAGTGRLAVGLNQQRIAAQPLIAVLLVLGGGLALAIGVAIWLARRVAAPLARLEQAATRIGQGEDPALLPETGPRELATLARRFNAMARQVRELLAARTTLLAGVSHDLRTPLARMRLSLELLKDSPAPELIARLESDIEEMNALIGTLLDLARGLEREPRQAVDLAEFLPALAAAAHAGGREIRVRCPPCRHELPPRALRRAVDNLLQNALRHAPTGPIELVCELSAARCRIGVLDRGPGIPPARMEAMFQPFQRLETSRSPTTGGAGLGLAIVRELARANGWQARLEARSGGGLAAWLDLPPPAR